MHIFTALVSYTNSIGVKVQDWGIDICTQKYSNTFFCVFIFLFRYFCEKYIIFIFVFEYLLKVFIFMNTVVNTYNDFHFWLFLS